MVGISRRWAQAALAAVAVVVLLLVVANGSRSLPGTDRVATTVGEGERPAISLGGLLRLAYFAILVSALYRWLLSRDEPRRGRGPHRRASPALTLLIILVIGGALVLGAALRDNSVVNRVLPPVEEEDEQLAEVLDDGEIADGPLTTVPEVLSEPGDRSPVETLLADPWLSVATLAVIVIAFLAFVLRRSPEEEEPPLEPVIAQEAPPPITRPLAANIPTDPRWRVFAAYAEVERVAGNRGLGRANGETVGRHLRRVGGAAARRLGEIYDRARFSAHDVDDAIADAAQLAARDLVGD